MMATNFVLSYCGIEYTDVVFLLFVLERGLNVRFQIDFPPISAK